MSHPHPDQWVNPQTDLTDAVVDCLRLLGFPKSREVLQAQTTREAQHDPDAYEAALEKLGITCHSVSIELEKIRPEQLPCVILLDQQRAVAVREIADDEITIVAPGNHRFSRIPKNELSRQCTGGVLLISPPASLDGRADDLVPQPEAHWFWPVIWRYRRYYFEAMSLAGIINILTLAGIIFTLTVYDRVLPNQAYVTLWSLAAGVVLAMILEFASRCARTWILDAAGKKIDLVLGDTIFDHVLRSRLEYRTQSSGSFANIFKEFEQVRGFVTSASLVAVADLPFALIFIAATAVIAGPLALIPMVAFLLVAGLSIALQWPLARLAQEGLRESSVRHGTVIESLEGLDTVKSARAEPRMRYRYDHASEIITRSAMKSATLAGITINGTMLIQQLATVALLIWGVYLVSAGEVTAGAIIASVQLTSRALAPLSGLTSLALRFQSIKSALASLDRIMKTPVDRDPQRQYLSGTHWQGNLELRHANFSYRAEEPPVIRDVNVSIRRGERIAILGRMGSGKSTLLRLLAGLYQPKSGSLMMDGVDSTQIEPADLRSTVMLLPQDCRLFHGTLRENLVLSCPSASDEEMLRVAEWTGVKAIAAGHPRAFERQVGERGDTLSAGQRQAIALTRALLARPNVLLLDEPTASMDQVSETAILQGLSREIGDSTLIVVTHKATVLDYVDRLIVVDNGAIVADGPKLEVIKALNEGNIKTR